MPILRKKSLSPKNPNPWGKNPQILKSLNPRGCFDLGRNEKSPSPIPGIGDLGSPNNLIPKPPPYIWITHSILSKYREQGILLNGHTLDTLNSRLTLFCSLSFSFNELKDASRVTTRQPVKVKYKFKDRKF